MLAHLTVQSLVSHGQLHEGIGLTAALLCRLLVKKKADSAVRQKKIITPRLKYLDAQARSGEGVNSLREERVMPHV